MMLTTMMIMVAIVPEADLIKTMMLMVVVAVVSLVAIAEISAATAPTEIRLYELKKPYRACLINW